MFGDGPFDLVFLSGVFNIDLAWSYDRLAAFFERLGSFCRVIAFDRRGVGVSDPVPEEALPTWEQWMEDLVAVIDAVGCERVAICAQLDAGPTAMLFAATRPERTRALILATTTARYLVDDDYPVGLAPQAIDILVETLRSLWGNAEGAGILNPSLGGDRDGSAALAVLQRSAFTPRRVAAYYDLVLRSLDVRSALSAVQVPTLVLHRSDFAFLPVSHGRWLADHITGARFVELPGRDPFLAFENAEIALDEIAEFMTGERRFLEVERVLTTVLFTDIADSTKLAAEVGDQRWHLLLDAHDTVVREQLRRFRGTEIKTTGDGFLASFDGPGRAIRCARAIGESARSLGLEIRAGMHSGECEVRGDDLGGLAVHIAARVAGLASSGEVLVSGTVKDLVAGSGIDFEDRGEHELKGVPGTWGLFAVTG